MTQLFLEELTLASLLKLTAELPPSEQCVYEALCGRPYEPQRAAAEVFLSPGLHHEFRRPDGEVVAAGGFIDKGHGIYRTWFAAPEWAWKAHGQEISRLCKQAVEVLLEGNLASRIETVTLADETRTRQWYEKIGLTYETTLRGRGSQDLVMYVAMAERANVR